MSDLQVDIDPVEIIDGELGTESTSAMFGQGIDRYGTVAVTDAPAEMLSSLQEETPAELWPSLQKMIDQVEDVTGLKWVQPLEVPAFFDWLNVDQGIAAITPEWVDSGQLYNYAYSWAQATGALPPGIPVSAPATAPVPAPVLTTPTQGTATTAAVAGTLVQRSVTAPGLTVAEAKAISTAISVALGDVQTLVAGGIDKMLPNLAPGQVPQALSQLYSAVAILERQYAAMRQQLSGPDDSSVLSTLAAIENTLSEVQDDVIVAEDQLELKAGSALETQVTGIGDQVSTNTDAIKTINTVNIPELGAGLAAVTTGLAVTNNLVNNEVVPQLATTTAIATQSAETLALTDADCIAALCDSINNVSKPIESGGATPSLLKNLGNMLKNALELGFAATIIDTLLTIANAKVAIAGVVSDTETISGWATKAAGVITTDLSWQGQLGT